MEQVMLYESTDVTMKAEIAGAPTESLVDVICVTPPSSMAITKFSRRSKQYSHTRGKGVVPCQFCSVSFSTNTNLNKHIRAFHPGLVKCDICDQPVLTDVEQHLNKVHNLTLKYSKLIFKSEVDFQLWKVEEEKRSGSQYVSTSGTKKTPACVAKRYFICHRSGKFQSHSKLPTQKQKKPRASVRCGVKCPARMTLTVDHSGRYLVDYQEAHYGHTLDIQSNQQIVDKSQMRRRLRQQSAQNENKGSKSGHENQSQQLDGSHREERQQVNATSVLAISDKASPHRLDYLESLWALRNSASFQELNSQLHMHFDRKNGVVLISEVGIVISCIMRPCFLSSVLFYETRLPSIYVRGVELLPETFQVGDMRSEEGFFGLLNAVLNGPKCPGAADQTDVFFDNANGYLDTTCRWRHENCPIFSSEGQECDGCASLRKLLQVAKQNLHQRDGKGSS
ncbi:uncharacterized protein LOC111260082 isoform X2 [Varroa jacobsoni]|uniref:C2H2-type domain-containing protein n=1 Tax=Varroa destructor TaxID=109461 RepID=A0A7M7JA49_VARDE|nr:uncharacterized protein LOC111245223 isoform X2 [Varroa destructor]XP_022688302.1 uncharacterized protein LOC111260082 isoform X2 [Varroa jacobsoni]